MTGNSGLSQSEAEMLDQQDRWSPADMVFGAMATVALIICCALLVFLIAAAPWVGPT